MANTQGTAIWYERVGPDSDAAQTFYADVVGWTIAPSGMAGAFDYRIATAPDGDGVAGFATPPAGMAMPHGWLVYYAVDDVDASAARVADLGGRVVMGPMALDGVGRFALVADPQGVIFYLMRGESAEDSRAFLPAPGGPGHGVWNELATPDPDAAFAFYGALFGWEKAGAMPMGDMGEYAFIGAGESRPGAIMSSTATGAPPRWNAYFHVPDIDAAVAAVTAGGGSVTQPPNEIPGGDYSAVVADLHGLVFGLVGARKAA